MKEYLGRELGQNLNTDEAPVFGAAFRAAGLSKRFKVKEIRVKDVTLFPISLIHDGPQELDSDGFLPFILSLPFIFPL